MFFPPPPQAWLLLRVWLCFSGGGFAVPGWEGGGGVRAEAAASRCRRHWSELGFLREMGSREQQASSYAALRPDAD